MKIIVVFIIEFNINFVNFLIIGFCVRFIVRGYFFILFVSNVVVNIVGFVFNVVYIGLIIGFKIFVKIGVREIILIIDKVNVFIVIIFFLNF